MTPRAASRARGSRRGPVASLQKRARSKNRRRRLQSRVPSWLRVRTSSPQLPQNTPARRRCSTPAPSDPARTMLASSHARCSPSASAASDTSRAGLGSKSTGAAAVAGSATVNGWAVSHWTTLCDPGVAPAGDPKVDPSGDTRADSARAAGLAALSGDSNARGRQSPAIVEASAVPTCIAQPNAPTSCTCTRRRDPTRTPRRRLHEPGIRAAARRLAEAARLQQRERVHGASAPTVDAEVQVGIRRRRIAAVADVSDHVANAYPLPRFHGRALEVRVVVRHPRRTEPHRVTS